MWTKLLGDRFNSDPYYCFLSVVSVSKLFLFAARTTVVTFSAFYVSQNGLSNLCCYEKLWLELCLELATAEVYDILPSSAVKVWVY